MSKSPEAFRTISEVAEWLETPAHVLRFWESKFTQVKPVKRAGGRRYYRPNDMLLLGGIKKLLHDDGMTIKGVQKILRERGVKYVQSLCVQPVTDEADMVEEAEPVAADETTVVPFAQPQREATLGPEPEEQAAPVEPAPVAEEPPAPSEPPAPEPVEEVAAEQESEADAAELREDASEAAAIVFEDAPEPEMPAEPEVPPEEEPATETSLADSGTEPASIAEIQPDDSAVGQESSQPVAEPSVPDAPPADAEPAPGPLSALARLHALTPEDAARIAPLAARLEAWVRHTARAAN